jgi:hypothetical protein
VSLEAFEQETATAQHLRLALQARVQIQCGDGTDREACPLKNNNEYVRLRN